MATKILTEASVQSSLESSVEPNAYNKKADLLEQSLSKPSFHITAPQGWLNDPCGPGYDPVTGQYHLFFQWNPHGNNWGNMSWGHSTSSDCVSWRTWPKPALIPAAEYDRCGVFTGCLQATDLDGSSGALTIVYTSVRQLPIHYTLPYVVGSESLSLATSCDGGKTWDRQECNPILLGPPQDLSVTGWRDPAIVTWSGLQQRTSQGSQPGLCGLISGGVVSQTPTVFIYTVDPTDLRNWQYAGLLVNVGLNFHPSRWSGDFGINWEVANLMTLTDDTGLSRDFVVMKVEGGLRQENARNDARNARHRRSPRAQLWMCIRQSLGNKCREKALATYAFAGIFDHGCFYAANCFRDPKTARQILYGWITDEDLPAISRHRQGWSGMISLPRTVRLTTLRNVRRARSSSLQSISSIELIVDEFEENTFTIHTLGILPDPRLSRLRLGSKKSQTQDLRLSPSADACGVHFLPLTTNRWELQTDFAVDQSCERVGIDIAHSPDFIGCTTLAWDSRSETFTIHRPTIQDLEINHGYESAPHTLFTFANQNGDEREETLRIHAFFDKSVLEVFVNERTVISTRIYHSSDRCFGLRFFAESGSENGTEKKVATLLQAVVWDGIGEK